MTNQIKIINGIKFRKRKNTSNVLEYWLSVRTEDDKGFIYHAWYSMPEIVRDIPECKLSIESVRFRVKQIMKGRGKHKTLWATISVPAETKNSSNIKLCGADWGLLDDLWKQPKQFACDAELN